MTFAILGGGQLDTGYTIDNSLIFNNNDSPRLTQTVPTTATSTKIMTWNLWFKRCLLSDIQLFCSSRLDGSNLLDFRFHSDDALIIQDYTSGNNMLLWTNRKFRDVSAWYNIHIVIDTTDATADDRTKIYINGVQETSFASRTNYSLNADVYRWNTSGVTRGIGYETDTLAEYCDGYFSEFHFIDGQALDPTSFGQYDSSGIWKPKQYTGSYGNNGFYLDFEDSGSLGADQSGNGNNFTPTNLASTDQTTDTPTNNFATCNPLNGQDPGDDIQQGSLILPADASGDIIAPATQGFSSGKWYMEFKSTISYGTGNRKTVGIYETDSNVQKPRAFTTGYVGCVVDLRVGDVYQDGVDTGNNISTFGDGDICGLFYDADNGNLYIAKNGTLQNSGSPVNSSALDTSKIYTFYFNQDGGGSNAGKLYCNFGNPPTGYTISSGNADANGYGNFEYNPVISSTNYLALCTQNLATELSPTIDDGSQYFNTLLWTGDGSNPRSLTGVGFQPDFLWTKARSSAFGHNVYDSTRGSDGTGYYRLETQGTDAEIAQPPAGLITSLDSDGFSVTNGSSSDNIVNNTGTTYVGWNWKCNGGTTSSNTDGSITSTVQANTTAGFSIVTYTGTGSNATVGHGLGKTLDMVLVKNRSASGRGWVVWHNALAGNEALELNVADAKITSATSWNSTVPTSSVFSVGTRVGTNESSQTFVAYCFANIEGYSKFGSYTGNGNADGAFVYTGFRPAFVIWKRTDSATDWRMLDTTRDSYNVADKRLFPNTTDAENTAQDTLDFLSNGFKHRATNSGGNASGGSYIYMCFAEYPFVSSAGIPVPAR